MLQSPPEYLRRLHFNDPHPKSLFGRKSHDSRGLESRVPNHIRPRPPRGGAKNHMTGSRTNLPLYCDASRKKFSYHQAPSTTLLHTPFCSEGVKRKHLQCMTGNVENIPPDTIYPKPPNDNREPVYANLIFRRKPPREIRKHSNDASRLHDTNVSNIRNEPYTSYRYESPPPIMTRTETSRYLPSVDHPGNSNIITKTAIPVVSDMRRISTLTVEVDCAGTKTHGSTRREALHPRNSALDNADSCTVIELTNFASSMENHAPQQLLNPTNTGVVLDKSEPTASKFVEGFASSTGTLDMANSRDSDEKYKPTSRNTYISKRSREKTHPVSTSFVTNTTTYLSLNSQTTTTTAMKPTSMFLTATSSASREDSVPISKATTNSLPSSPVSARASTATTSPGTVLTTTTLAKPAVSDSISGTCPITHCISETSLQTSALSFNAPASVQNTSLQDKTNESSEKDLHQTHPNANFVMSTAGSIGSTPHLSPNLSQFIIPDTTGSNFVRNSGKRRNPGKRILREKPFLADKRVNHGYQDDEESPQHESYTASPQLKNKLSFKSPRVDHEFYNEMAIDCPEELELNATQVDKDTKNLENAPKIPVKESTQANDAIKKSKQHLSSPLKDTNSQSNEIDPMQCSPDADNIVETTKSPSHRHKKPSSEKIYRSKKPSGETERTCKSVKSLISKYNAISRSDDDSSEPVSDQIINSIKSHASARSRIPSFLDYKSRESYQSKQSESGNQEKEGGGDGAGVGDGDGCGVGASDGSVRDNANGLRYTPSAFDTHLYNRNDLEDIRWRTRRLRGSYSKGKRRPWRTLRRKLNSFFCSSRTRLSDRRGWKKARRKVNSLFRAPRPKPSNVLWQFAPKPSRTEINHIFRQSMQGTYKPRTSYTPHNNHNDNNDDDDDNGNNDEEHIDDTNNPNTNTTNVNSVSNNKDYNKTITETANKETKIIDMTNNDDITSNNNNSIPSDIKNKNFTSSKSCMLEDESLLNILNTSAYDQFPKEDEEEVFPDVTSRRSAKKKPTTKKEERTLSSISSRIYKKYLKSKGQAYYTTGQDNAGFQFETPAKKTPKLHEVGLVTSPYDLFRCMEEENRLTNCNDSFEAFLVETSRIKKFERQSSSTSNKEKWKNEDTLGIIV